LTLPQQINRQLTDEQLFQKAYLLNVEASQRAMLPFTKFTFPAYETNWHHRVTAAHLDQVIAGQLRRVIFLMPPQNGKSELVSRRFPAFALGKNPDLRIIATSYGGDLAGDMSRDVQKIMDSSSYHTLFPETRLAEAADDEVKTVRQFAVVGRRGYYYAAGIGGAITGKSCDIGIIDDPIKNRKEAESKVYRDAVWDWFVSVFQTRQFGSTAAIVIAVTRWHEDDLVGRLLRLAATNPAAEKWVVVRFEAVCENPDRRIDHREMGEPLWPSKYPLRELEARKQTAGSYDWLSLYQQQPTSPGGKLFKREWLTKFVDFAPAAARRCRGWDTAGSEEDGDYTAGIKIAELDGTYYVEDAVRGQWGPHKVDLVITATVEVDGPECMQREEKEGGSSGLAVIAARAQSLSGSDYAGVPTTGSKILRSKPFRAQCEAGNVVIVRGTWNADYISELCDFPTGLHDDQVDGSSAAFNSLVAEQQAIAGAWGRG
jgi:predicted phage terminase large subunit-like protein